MLEYIKTPQRKFFEGFLFEYSVSSVFKYSTFLRFPYHRLFVMKHFRRKSNQLVILLMPKSYLPNPIIPLKFQMYFNQTTMINEFFASARNKNQWYWYLLTLLILFVFAVIFSVPLITISHLNGVVGTTKSLTAKDLNISDAMFLGLQMFTSISLTVGVIVAAWIIHKRSWKSLITAYDKVRWGRFFFGNLLWLGLMIGAELITYAINPDNYVFQFEATQVVALLLVSVLTIPLQAAGEELIFRGYLMQGIGWGTKRPWIALILTSIGFGCLHLANPEIEKYGQEFIVTYIITGLFFGIITLMDDGLELAIGVHTVNNIYNAVLVTFPASALELPTAFRIKVLDPWTVFAISVIFYIFFIWICAKRYGWTDWGKLTRKIIDPNPDVDLQMIDSIGIK